MSQPKQFSGGTRSLPDVARRTFVLKGKLYSCVLTWEEVKAGREWKPGLPLPLTLEKAEEIARRALRKFVSDEPAWQVTDFSIGRFRPTDGANWYYAVTLKPELWIGVSPDTFTVLMNSSGELGTISPVESRGAFAPHRD